MGEHVITMPDVGEGIAEAELAEWYVKVGEFVREDAVLADVTTDKATVEIPSPVTGQVVWLGAKIGEVVAVGAPLIRLSMDAESNGSETHGDLAAGGARSGAVQAGLSAVDHRLGCAGEPPAESSTSIASTDPSQVSETQWKGSSGARSKGEKPMASPAVRLRARKAGIDLGQVHGSGPLGRVTHEDLDAYLARGAQEARTPNLVPNTSVEHIKVTGVRRRIAEKMAVASSRIPHITYVEEIDVTTLEDLRATLNANRRADRPKLTLLPLLMRALVRAVAEQPHMNALYEDEAGIIHQHGGVHIGIATQTPSGLVVPVVRHAEARNLWSCAAELHRLAEAAKAGKASRQELGGSTITVTSLGALGGLASTPIINHPEVAIIGVNRIIVRPVWSGATFIPRKMMNLSSSFDHRVIDGYDAAAFIQRIKSLLETPALIFVEA
ncbi:dihydrolipoamide acetyltransferase family protein [Methylobacterium nigriterrae]|uniref:dihydrolipoamide acetyltransferase family protein n=1 Tax=Methylobacterium nigriterrae TaxID=3127512 RepID=UPI00301325F6